MPFNYDILKLDDRLRMLLEALPRLAAVQPLERAWRRRATGYIAHNDFTGFRGLLHEVDRLARALGVGRNGKINTGLAAATLPAPAPRVHHQASGPGLPGWGRPSLRRSVPSSWRRPHAPLRYPWGPEPPVSPPRRSDPVTVPRYTGPYWVDPWLARVRAEADGELEALRRHGEVQYHGPDAPPTYALRDNV